MLSRRDCLVLSASSAAALALGPRLASAQFAGPINRRPIPSSGEELPIIGLGSSATFSELASAEEIEALKGVFETMVESGGSVFDTAPSYGRGSSEEVGGQIAAELGIGDRIFWATKVNALGFRAGPGATADPAAVRQQLETSYARLQRNVIDLIQVHNVADLATQFPILQEYKQADRVRYIGATTTFKPQYETLEQFMRSEPLDFIGIDYAVDNRDAADTIFPLARDRGIAVMVYMPFGRTRLWDRVSGHEVPAWAREFGAESWAQFFLKYAASHPDVTVVTPATSKPHHMLDNMAAAYGRMPDAAERRRMAEYVDALPGG